MSERIDLYTPDLRLTGQTILRGETVPDGLFRVVAGFIVCHTDGMLLLTLRDHSKTECPDMYEMTGSGGVRAGESAADGCLREMREETGLVPCEPPQLLYTDVRADMRAAFCTYLCLYNGSKDAVRLQKGETAAYRWLSPEEVLRMERETPERIYLSPGGRLYLETQRMK